MFRKLLPQIKNDTIVIKYHANQHYYADVYSVLYSTHPQLKESPHCSESKGKRQQLCGIGQADPLSFLHQHLDQTHLLVRVRRISAPK